jgi:hypothetical protein
MLDQLEPAEADPEVFRPISSLFYWPLWLVFIVSGLLALRAVLRDLLARRAFSKATHPVNEGQSR